LPLLESKMLYLWNHRFGDFALLAPGEREHILPQVPADLLNNTHYLTSPRYWVEAEEVSGRLDNTWNRTWLLGWRRVTDARSSVRTLVSCVLPKAGTGDSFFLAMPQASPSLVACLLANLSSHVLDYATRQKLAGVNLNYFIMKQLPALRPTTYDLANRWAPGKLVDWIAPRVLELTYTAWDVESFARDLGHQGTPFRWDAVRRSQLRGELDAAFFHLYGLSRDDVDYVMETFPIVRKNDEKAYGEYRTKRIILETYDALAKAVESGKQYRTPLDPLPAAIGASHGWYDPSSTPKDYAEALRLGLLFTLIRRSGDAGISQSTLSRALLWLEDAKHAATGLQGTALADFQRLRESDPLLSQGVSDTSKLLQALEKVITRDAKGVVKLRAGSTIPNWLPQTPTLAKLASVMRAGLEQAESGAATTPDVEKAPVGKAKRA
jgi:hypothetical protein